jgi:hypothetical protein
MKVNIGDLPPEMFHPGRIYGPGWSIENVARRLRFEADRGFLRGVDFKADAEYRKKCSARHVPSGCSVIFTRDDVPLNPKGYHASICFVGESGYEPWNEATADRWLLALFGADVARVKAYTAALTPVGRPKGVRHFLLEVERW